MSLRKLYRLETIHSTLIILTWPLCFVGLVFCLPPESGEKVSLAVTLLLAMTVFLLVVMENIPSTSEVVPQLGKLKYFHFFFIVCQSWLSADLGLPSVRVCLLSVVCLR